MSAALMRGSDSSGLLLATGALCILLWQAGLGKRLRDAQGARRNRTRRLHFWTMALLIGLVTAHIILNRA